MTKGDRIKARREELGLTQTDLAEAISSTKQNIYKYENNIISNIPSDKVEAIAEVLKISPAYLMGWGDEYNHFLPPNATPIDFKNLKRIPILGRIAAGVRGFLRLFPSNGRPVSRVRCRRFRQGDFRRDVHGRCSMSGSGASARWLRCPERRMPVARRAAATLTPAAMQPPMPCSQE